MPRLVPHDSCLRCAEQNTTCVGLCAESFSLLVLMCVMVVQHICWFSTSPSAPFKIRQRASDDK